MRVKNPQNSWFNGLYSVSVIERKIIEQEIMTAINVAKQHYIKRRAGYGKLTVEVKEKVEKIFRAHNVPLYKIWGDNRKNNESEN